MDKYEWEVLMESGIIHKVLAENPFDAANIVVCSEVYGPDSEQAYREVGTAEWIVY